MCVSILIIIIIIFFMRLTRRAEGHRYQSFGHYLNYILDNERNEKIYYLYLWYYLLILYLS